MLITEEWIEKVSDEEGLTRGQSKLLDIWCKEKPYDGKEIPDQVAHFIERSRSYRGIPEELRGFLGWT